MNKKGKILLHQDELKTVGFELKGLSEISGAGQAAHRDDHYMFIVQRKGRLVWELDFSEITLKGPALCYVTPGQVHRYVDIRKPEGWLIFVEPAFVSKEYREIFDTFLNSRQHVALATGDELFQLVEVLEKFLAQKRLPLNASLLDNLVRTIVGAAASGILQLQRKDNPAGGAKYRLATSFKQLVKQKFRECKQVKEYAAQLHITPLYLNEVMKEITGFPAGYWLYQEIILEAKRLLYYSDLDIKRIAYELGYEDHAYFSRFFKKNTGMTATEFKNKKPSFV